ncbi:hypothetical protein T310_6837 [Rasamsonia emersonii CBS 393.64]|uniref:Uncharacterized protein n=1 Tax=Rasamsonia emersonii (strain ATCC 16479 / CBS 393.64 / IMI 116815) TaxID=1408163 RepID=A0A0F4YMZ2_RASE3|nr:hypothetical protein T310_6837 [Rasamsonia emersonii CBS 393.64]KKA19201.1 hypothetical protein T310_6837 [Rasamsonia emersonii CBS 393.64]
MDFPRLHTLDSFLSIPIVIFGLLKVVSCIYANRLGLRYNIYIIASIVFLSAAVAVLVLSVHGLEWTSTASPIPAFYFLWDCVWYFLVSLRLLTVSFIVDYVFLTCLSLYILRQTRQGGLSRVLLVRRTLDFLAIALLASIVATLGLIYVWTWANLNQVLLIVTVGWTCHSHPMDRLPQPEMTSLWFSFPREKDPCLPTISCPFLVGQVWTTFAGSLKLRSHGIPATMAEGPQAIDVTEIAHDEKKLLERAQREVKEWRESENSEASVTVTLDKDWTVCNADGKDPGIADPSVRALLVTQNCSWGAVRVDSNPVTNVVTGNGKRLYIVTIEPGQICLFYQHPSVRYFRQQGSSN